MFESLTTYSGFSSATFSGSMVSSSFASSSTLGSSFRSSVGTAAPISVRTSDKTLRSFTTAGTSGYITPTGTGSFSTIHNEVSEGICASALPTSNMPGKAYVPGKPDDKPIGETETDFPVGDALLPMLLISCVYLLTRIFRNRKKPKTINQSINK